MKVINLEIQESEFKGTKIQQLFITLDNGEQYLIGTLKPKNDFWKVNSINCVHKEFKKKSN